MSDLAYIGKTDWNSLVVSSGVQTDPISLGQTEHGVIRATSAQHNTLEYMKEKDP